MELSTLFIAVVFIIPLVMGLFILGAMAADTQPATPAEASKPAKPRATADNDTGSIGNSLPA